MLESHLPVPVCRHHGARRLITDKNDAAIAHRDKIIGALHRLPAGHIERAVNMTSGKLGFGTHVHDVIDAIGGMRNKIAELLRRGPGNLFIGCDLHCRRHRLSLALR